MDAKPTQAQLGDALVTAAAEGDVDEVARLLDAGAPVDYLDADDMGKTALMYAVDPGEPDLVDLLIERGANVNLPSQETGFLGWTALLYAADCFGADHEAIIRKLAAAGADLDHQDGDGQTALMLAVRRGEDRLAAVAALVELGADPECKNSHGDTALVLAQSHSNPKAAAILEQGGASADAFAVTKFMDAAKKGHVKKVKAALDAGIDVDTVHYGTALTYAAMHGRTKVVELLIAHGADVNKPEHAGDERALHRAAYNGHAAIVAMLLEAGADPSLVDDEGEDPRTKVKWGRINNAAPAANHDAVIRLLDEHAASE